MSENKLVIETELGTKTFDAQYNELERKLKHEQKKLTKALSPNLSGTKGIVISPEKISETQAKIESLSNKMIDLRLKVKNTGDETDGMSQKTDFNFKKMGNTVKKYALALVGLRSIYSLVSRASSAYLSQDTELAEKLQSVWVGLGSFLAPVLEMISDGLLKALGYLNVFIKALTGIDFLARANAKALQSQAKAQKELNRQTYDFDVIRTQQENKGSGASSSGGLFQIPELDQNLVNKLQDLAKWLRENWDLIKKVGEALLITFGAVKIAKVLKGVATLLGSAGAGTGLLGLQSILTGLLTIGVVTLGVYLLYTAMTGRDLIKDLKDIKDGLKEVKEMTEKQTEAEKNYTSQLKEFNEQVKEKIQNGTLDKEQLNTYTNFLKNNTRATTEQIKNITTQKIVTKKMREELKAYVEDLKETTQAYEFLYQQGLLNEQETENYKRALATQIGTMQYLGQNTDELKQKYNNLTNQNWNLKLTASDYASSTIEKIKNKLVNLLGVSASSVLSGARNAIKQTFGFAQGGIVTQPTRALIGEAGYPEAVVPMTQDYLSTLASEIARFGGSGGGGTVNVYLDGRLIQRQVSTRENQRNFATNR